MLPANICGACRSRPVELSVDDDDPQQPYKVCSSCAHRLRALSLRPVEWFNLAAIHSPVKFLLHSDFYDQDGTADQAKEAVEHPKRYPAPTLEAVRGDLQRLVDYAMTRWWLEDDVVQAFARHDKAQVLAVLRDRTNACSNHEVESRSYELCATVLSPVAGDWIRERWQVYDARVLFSLAQASANCLPFEEGYGKVLRALMDVPPQELVDVSIVLAWFRSEKTLDWLESHASYIVNSWKHVSDSWGQLAALSRFSWARAATWLDRGRPLSLVALDALKALQHYDTGLLQMFSPKLSDPAPLNEMVAKLRDYAEKDAVPRVERAVTSIIDGWTEQQA